MKRPLQRFFLAFGSAGLALLASCSFDGFNIDKDKFSNLSQAAEDAGDGGSQTSSGSGAPSKQDVPEPTGKVGDPIPNLCQYGAIVAPGDLIAEAPPSGSSSRDILLANLASPKQGAAYLATEIIALTVKAEIDDIYGLGTIEIVAVAGGKNPSFAFTKTISETCRNIKKMLSLELQAKVEDIPPSDSDSAQYGVAQFSQSPSPWGLDRLDSTTNTFDNTFNYNHSGKGVIIYVVDTGVYAAHNELKESNSNNSRVLGNVNIINDFGNGNGCAVNFLPPTWAPIDHGTGLASLAAGLTYGSAKDAYIVSVHITRCTDLNTTSAALTKGLDWIYNNHPVIDGVPAPGVVLLAVALKPYSKIEQLTKNLINTHKLTIITAAGGSPTGAPGSGEDACNLSPQRLSTTDPVINVGAMDKNGVQAPYSNYGSCITAFAPGGMIDYSNPNNNNYPHLITTAGIGSPSATGVCMGTSPASAQIAGLAADFIQKYRAQNSNTNPTPVQVKAALVNNSIANALTLYSNLPTSTRNVFYFWPGL
jgi:subtilisin family serine protease